MIRFIYRWYQRVWNRVDPERDEAQRARDIERNRERKALYRLALDSMDSEDPVRKKRGTELYKYLMQLDAMRLMGILGRRW